MAIPGIGTRNAEINQVKSEFSSYTHQVQKTSLCLEDSHCLLQRIGLVSIIYSYSNNEEMDTTQCNNLCRIEGGIELSSHFFGSWLATLVC